VATSSDVAQTISYHWTFTPFIIISQVWKRTKTTFKVVHQ